MGHTIVISGIEEEAVVDLVSKAIGNNLLVDSVEQKLVHVLRLNHPKRDMIEHHFYQHLKQKNGITGKDIGMSSADNIYIGEHLTGVQHELLTKAKQSLRKSGKYKHVWIQNGSVLARQSDGGNVEKIRCALIKLYERAN